MHGASRGEIPLFGVVRSLAHRHRADQLRDEKADVGIALAVAVGAHIDRHARDPDREIGTVIKVEPAQEVLVRLALPAVLRDDQAGHRFEYFARPQRRKRVDRRAGKNLLARGVAGWASPWGRRRLRT
jgi:hypothetical protein